MTSLFVSAQTEWEALLSTTAKWFYQPDALVLRAVLAAVKALDLNLSTVWLMILGPPSSAKTTLYLSPAAHKNRFETSGLSEAALLPLYRDKQGNRERGLLEQIGTRGIWVIKDFGSILSMREETRNTVSAAMREVYDGKWARKGGTGSQVWVGKCHVLAAATNAIERFHHLIGDLGDRFLSVRVDRIEGLGWHENAAGQRGQLERIKAELNTVGSQLLGASIGSPVASLEKEDSLRLAALAEITAIGRTPVNYTRAGELLGPADTEIPVRLYQALESLAIGDATLRGCRQVDEESLRLATRVALDTLPQRRGAILRAFLPSFPRIQRPEVKEAAQIKWREQAQRAIDEMVAIGMLRLTEEKGKEAVCHVDDSVEKLWHTAHSESA